MSTLSSSGSMTSIIHPHPIHTAPSPLVQSAVDKPISLQPPPLPPRRRNRDSTNSDVFLTQTTPDPPQIPPRGNPPPPVPPRRDSMFNNTLPRSHSVSQQTRNSSSSLSTHNNSSATLPRYSMVEKDTATRSLLPSMLNVNGDNTGAPPTQSVTPRLPPRTYRIAHSRQRSS